MSKQTPIEALDGFDFTVNTHKDATMKNVVVWKYDPNAPLIRAKTNYAKDKYNEDTKIQRRLRSRIVSLIRDERLVSFVGEETDHDTKTTNEIKNGDK